MPHEPLKLSRISSIRLPQCGKQIYPMTPGLLEQVMGGDFKTEWETAQVGFQIDSTSHSIIVSSFQL